MNIIKLALKYEIDELEKLVLVEVLKNEYPFDFEDELNLEKELEAREIDSINKLKNIYKGRRISIATMVGVFEGIILTISKGKVYLEVDNFTEPNLDIIDCFDTSSFTHCVRIFELEDIGMLRVIE